MKLPILKIAELTGVHRDTISKRLADLPFEAGKKGAKLYESTVALPLIYAVDNLESARAKQALSQASLNAVREEELRKERIPIQLVLDELDTMFQAMGAILKNNAKLSEAQTNEIFGKFRDLPARLKW
jgi:hypothetical protein